MTSKIFAREETMVNKIFEVEGVMSTNISAVEE